MRRVGGGFVAVVFMGTVLAFFASGPVSARASVSPGGATVTAGQGTTARASFTPTGAITCGAVSGGGPGVSGSLDDTSCHDGPFTTTLRVSTASTAAAGSYTFTITDTADGDSTTSWPDIIGRCFCTAHTIG